MFSNFFHRWRWGWSSKRKAVFKTGKFLLCLVLFFTVAVNIFFIVETSKKLNLEETRGGPSEPGLLGPVKGVDKRGRGTCRAMWYVGTCRRVDRKMVKMYYTKRSNFVRARTYSYGTCTYHRAI